MDASNSVRLILLACLSPGWHIGDRNNPST
jgi:hypothetical protein